MSDEPTTSAFLAPMTGTARETARRYNDIEAAEQRAFYEMQTPKVRGIVDTLAALRFDGLRFDIKAGVWFEDPGTILFRLTTNAILLQPSEMNCQWRATELDAARYPIWTYEVRKMTARMVTAIAASSASVAPGSAAAWAAIFGDGQS